jgi:hypothetical protein
VLSSFEPAGNGGAIQILGKKSIARVTFLDSLASIQEEDLTSWFLLSPADNYLRVVVPAMFWS